MTTPGINFSTGDWLGVGYNVWNAGQNQANWDQYQGRVDQQVARGYDAIRGMGQLAGEIAPLAGNLEQQSYAYYGGSAPQNRFDQAFGGISQGYGQAQGNYQQAMQPTLGGYNQLANTLPGQYNRGAGQISQGYGQLGSRLDAGYGQRLQTGMGMLAGYGQQQLRDVNQSYRISGANLQADLASRGLSSTTATLGAQQGNLRERAAAMGRAREGIATTMFDAYSGLSQDRLLSRENIGLERLGADERFLEYGTNLRSDLRTQQLNAQRDATQFGADLGMEGLAGQEGIAAGRLDYGDAAQQTLLANQQAYGMMPIDARWNALQAELDWMGQIQYQPPGYG